MNLIERAQNFAHEAHNSIGQVRKYTLVPYWVHTDEVAAMVAEVGGTNQMVAAAHLHDVLEDVSGLRNWFHPFGPTAINSQFGHEVFLLVLHLTDLFTHESFPNLRRSLRKELERNRYSFVPNEVKTIKLADLISNTKDIVHADPKFAPIYLEEKRLLLPRLKGGNRKLMALAESLTHEPA